MRTLAFALLLISAGSAIAETPKLLLTPQRLRRLQRDRDRQTPRWLSFEKRVQQVPDSPERGFELALYYAITHDEARGKEAIEWAMAHRCELRQVSLVLDWIGDRATAEQRRTLADAVCNSTHQEDFAGARDALFASVVKAADTGSRADTLFQKTVSAPLPDAWQLYAMSEYLDVKRGRTGIRTNDDVTSFLNNLPVQYLLSMRPDELEHPSWEAHIAALALVNVNPNLESSQFLQGWAMEERFTVEDGPGVAYEFLWANPYLPGVSYQNMDPWLYRPGRLSARTDWTEHACWIKISGTGVTEQNCPSSWQTTPQEFGRLKLIPVAGKCVDLPQAKYHESTVLWKLPPGGRISYKDKGEPRSAQVDPAGMWQVAVDAQGKVCLER